MSKTVVMSVSDFGWVVYRIRTVSSHYHLALLDAPVGQRRCAVLQGVSRGAGRKLDVQDSTPLIGGKPLFEVPIHEWVGKSLQVGTATTSELQSVERETDWQIVTEVTNSIQRVERGPSRQTVTRVTPTATSGSSSASSSDWAPYPEDYVERVELAARLLRMAYQRRELPQDLAGRPELLDRFQVAMTECLLMLKGIGGRMAG